MALRHAAAMIIGGRTIAHYLQRYRARRGAPPRGTIVIIDEWSEVHLHTWAELAKWKLVGVTFVLIGDADGQRKPINDYWADATDITDIRETQLIHELCGGLRVNLTEYRRGEDPKLFAAYTGLYPIADDDTQVGATIARLAREYPTGSRHDCLFVLSHRSGSSSTGS